MPVVSPHSDDVESLASELRRIIVLDLRGRADVTSRLRRNLIARVKRRLSKGETARLWTLLGDVYERRDSARDAFRRALVIDPNHVEAIYALAEVEFAAGSATAAEALIDRSLALTIPDHLSAMLYDLAWRVYRGVGRSEDCKQAISRYRQACESCPDRHRPMGELAPEFFEDDELLIGGPAES